jgi:hypothetical protein
LIVVVVPVDCKDSEVGSIINLEGLIYFKSGVAALDALSLIT